MRINCEECFDVFIVFIRIPFNLLWKVQFKKLVVADCMVNFSQSTYNNIIFFQVLRIVKIWVIEL